MPEQNQQSVPDTVEALRLARLIVEGDVDAWCDQDSDKLAAHALLRLEEQFDAAMDCMNYAWTIICNVSEGDWAKQSQEWQDAAARCRDQYHALLDSNPAKRPT